MKDTGPKRILFVSPVGEFYGGGERSGFEFCKYLQKNGHHVITAIPKSSKKYLQELENLDMEYRLMNCNDFESQIMEGNSLFFDIVSQLIDTINNDKIDIVITNLYAMSGPIAAAITGVPNISMDRGQAYVGTYFSDFMARFSDSVIVNSMGLAEIYRDKYQIEAPVVYSYTKKPEVGLDKNIKEQRIVCVSRVSPDKDLLQVLKAVHLLKTKGVFDGNVLMIGPVAGEAEENYKKELISYIENNNLENNIQWHGDQRDPWRLVGENDIYVNTSVKESVGRSSIEAIKLGVPAVLVDIPGHRDIIEKIGTASYKAGNTSSLAEKIQHIIENYKEAKIEADRARLNAEKLINEENCNKVILPIIEGLHKKTRVTTVDIFSYTLDLANSALDRLNSCEEASVYEISKRDQEIASRDTEIASYLGIKRSARLLAGNVKRRIARTLS